MRVLLVDVDSKIPNLALKQLSQYYKDQGDSVGFDIQNPEKVYISCIFTKNRGKALGIGTMFPTAEIIFGGSGINYTWLPPEIQKIKPDYTLYRGEYYSQGFTTRGCPRKCLPCIVRDKEGKYQRWQHVKEFHDDKFNIVMLMDNNILADKEWFFENTNWIIERKLKVIEHGMDIRLLTNEIAEQLSKIKFIPTLHFAFDTIDTEEDVEVGCGILYDNHFDLRRNIQFYVLAGFGDSTFEDALYRCNRLKELGTNAYVMPYHKKDKRINKLARWANRKEAYWSNDFSLDFKKKAKS